MNQHESLLPEKIIVKKKKKYATGFLLLPKTWRKPQVIKWLKRTHGWLGLWGAILGFLFALSGFILNHRAVMKIPAGEMTETEIIVNAPGPSLSDIDSLAQWVMTEFSIQSEPNRKRIIKGKTVQWNNQTYIEPSYWKVSFNNAKYSVNVDHQVGTNDVKIRRRTANTWSILNRLHMGVNGHPVWIILADSFAIGLMVLCITGTLLWTRFHGPRIVVATMASITLSGILYFATTTL